MNRNLIYPPALFNQLWKKEKGLGKLDNKKEKGKAERMNAGLREGGCIRNITEVHRGIPWSLAESWSGQLWEEIPELGKDW